MGCEVAGQCRGVHGADVGESRWDRWSDVWPMCPSGLAPPSSWCVLDMPGVLARRPHARGRTSTRRASDILAHHPPRPQAIPPVPLDTKKSRLSGRPGTVAPVCGHVGPSSVESGCCLIERCFRRKELMGIATSAFGETMSAMTRVLRNPRKRRPGRILGREGSAAG